MQWKEKYVQAKSIDPFTHSTWESKDLTYAGAETTDKINPLNFVYLIPAKSIKLCDIFFGLTNKITEEAVDEDYLQRFQPPRLHQDHESVGDHDVDPDSENPSFKFLNYSVKPNLEENRDFVFATISLFALVKKLIPRTFELKRVVYKRSVASMIQVELRFVYLPVLILVDEDARTKKLTRKNMKNYLYYLSFSRFMNWFSIAEYLKEFAISEHDLHVSDVANSMLRFADGGFGLNAEETKRIFNEILRGSFKAKNLKYTAISEEMFQASNGFIFHVRESGFGYIKFGGKNPIKETGSLAIENGATSGAPSYGYSGVSNLTSGYQYGYSTSYGGNLYSNNLYDNDVTEPLNEEELNDGIVGFKNIGNTCYMNSAMQCLVHIDFLKTFLIENQFESMINEDNPIGAKGDLIKSLAALVKEYWNSRDNYVTPYAFKRCVSKYMPAFEGYSHHDSQEFLSQLLDTCHEDTNQILKKPYTSTPTLQPGSKSDQQMARESWILHLRRNNSFFIHNFFGQFRSEIECPTCRSVYLKFDCFQVVSLPVPARREDSVDFFLVLDDQRQKKALKTRFKSKSYSNFNDVRISDVKLEICKKDEDVAPNALLRFGLMGFDEESLLLYDHRTLADLLLYEDQRTYPDLFIFQLNSADRAALSRKSTRVVRDELTKSEAVETGPEVPAEEIEQNCNKEQYLATRDDLVFVQFGSRFDYYDKQSPLYEQIKHYQPRYYSLKKSPVFAKAFYVTPQHRVIDLYFRVFEKFHFKMVFEEEKKKKSYNNYGYNYNYNYNDCSSSEYTSSEEEKPETPGNPAAPKEEPLEGLSKEQQFERLMKNDLMFFYLRVNGIFYGEQEWYKPLKDFAGEYSAPGQENVLKVEVFFREGERKKMRHEKKIPRVDLKYFTACRYQNYPDFLVLPPEYNEKQELKYSLEKLLTKFSEPEMLDNQNMYRCAKCQKEVKAQIKMEIQKVPRVLVIFFKRIKKSYYDESPDIAYPLELDMGPFVNDPSPMEAYAVRADEILDEANVELYRKRAQKKPSQKIKIENVDSSGEEGEDLVANGKIKEEGSEDAASGDPLEKIYLPDAAVQTNLQYELFGVVNHYGSQNFGHYTSTVKTSRDWVNFNDDRTSTASMQDVVNKNAYMLFYMRKDL